MKIALEVSKMSYAINRKVGSVIVNEGNTIAFGYNGQPTGFPNQCEAENGITLASTIHAELNAILKAAKSGAKIEGSTIYITLSPCANCALLSIQSGIKRVVYLEQYRDTTGIEILQKAGIIVEQIELNNN